MRQDQSLYADLLTNPLIGDLYRLKLSLSPYSPTRESNKAMTQSNLTLVSIHQVPRH